MMYVPPPPVCSSATYLHTDLRFPICVCVPSPQSHAWVGAWWIGFVFIGCLGLILSVCLCSQAPLQRPPSSGSSQQHQQQQQGSGGTAVHNRALLTAEDGNTPGAQASAKPSLVRQVRQVLTVPYVLLGAMGSSCEGALVSSMSAFLPKVTATDRCCSCCEVTNPLPVV